MSIRSIYESSVMLELARTLSDVQQQIILSLRERGPGLLLEIAVRVLKFPDEVSAPLADLAAKRLAASAEFSGGAFGNALWSLTPQGEQMAALLRDAAFLDRLQQARQVEPPVAAGQSVGAAASPDPRRQEADLLQSLGDMARARGDFEKAATYYEQALDATRKLSVAAGQ